MARNRAKHFTLAPLSVAMLAVLSGIGSPASAVADPHLRLDTGMASYKLAPLPAAPGDRPDGDNDGLFDDDEINVYGTKPDVADTDGDGTNDGEEVYLKTDPKVSNPPAARPDGDNDGLYNDDEIDVYGTKPDVADTDGDGTNDGEEVFNKTDPKVSNNPGPNPAPNPAPNPGNPAPNPAPGAPAAGDFSGEVLGLINQQRTAAGCAALPTNPQLTAAAARHANDMVKNKLPSDSHTGSDNSSGESRFKDSGWPAGKNAFRSAEIVFSYPGLTPQKAIDGWMNSPGHKGHIVNCSWTEIGVSAPSNGERMAAVAVFAKPTNP